MVVWYEQGEGVLLMATKFTSWQSNARSTPVIATDEAHLGLDRYACCRPLLLIPILPNWFPDPDNRMDGLMTELGTRSLLATATATGLPTGRHYVIGVEQRDLSMAFVAATCQGWQADGSGYSAEFTFVEREYDPLAVEALTPQLSGNSHHFTTRLAEEVIRAWISVGVVRPVLLHRLYVCPECRAVPVFGGGCRNCGSSRLVASQLIHHYSCAHVGTLDEFLQGDTIVCPKCHLRGLVVGTDFENLEGPHTCLECATSSSELEHVGLCLHCGLRFPQHHASELEMTGYDVIRLDPMAMLDAVG